MNDTTHDDTKDEELPEDLLDATEQVAENNPEAVEAHREATKEAEQYLVGEVADETGYEYDTEQYVEAVREVTGGGPESADEIRADVAEQIAEADAGIAIYLAFDDDGDLSLQTSARWFDDEDMSEAEQVATEYLLGEALDRADAPSASCTCGECGDGPQVSAMAMPVPSGGLGELLGGMAGGEDHDDEPPEFGGFA